LAQWKNKKFFEGKIMLLAIDIDGVCATYQGTDAIGTYLRAMDIPLSTNWRLDHYQGMMMPDALLQDPLYTAWYAYNDEPQEYIKKVLHEAQYHRALQECAVPVEGSAETLSKLVEDGHRVMYVTNRKNITWDVTSSWLARYSFPSPEKLHCCGDEKGFYSKVSSAIDILSKNEHLIFVDDMAKYYEPIFARKIKEDNHFVRYVRRLAVIRFGSSLAPACPYRYPVFPLAPMTGWGMLDDTLAVLVPFIGADCKDFFEEDFEPALLRRTPAPRKESVSLSA